MMQTTVKVTSMGDGWDEAAELTERVGAESRLKRSEVLRLRLLAEELIGMLRGIAGNVEAEFGIERLYRQFTLRLTADIAMSREMHERLIAVSSQKKNDAAQSFMGKLREMIAVALLPKESGEDAVADFSLGIMGAAGNTIDYSTRLPKDTFYWSMQQYRENVESGRGNETAAAWDELEKSIVANIADEVSVRIVGTNVGITIEKTFR